MALSTGYLPSKQSISALRNRQKWVSKQARIGIFSPIIIIISEKLPSIKLTEAVLPAITGKGYEDLDISDGQLASVSFLAATYGDMSEEDKEKVMSDLEEYCGRDTEGMIWIVEKLKELSM